MNENMKCSSYAELSGGLQGLLDSAVGHMRASASRRISPKQLRAEADWIEGYAKKIRAELRESQAEGC
jgi:hypothetical protein